MLILKLSQIPIKLIILSLVVISGCDTHNFQLDKPQKNGLSKSMTTPEGGMRGYTIIGVETSISDLEKIKDQNVNVVKWMLYHTVAWTDETNIEEYQTWLLQELDRLDEVMEKSRQLNLKVIIELMDVPGGRYYGGSQRLFYNEKFNDQFVQMWKQIAKRYNANPALYGYGLINEPVLSENLPVVYDNIQTQSRAARAIREIDTSTHLIFSSNSWNNPNPFFSDIVPFTNIIYELHMYDPHEYTHQNVLGLNLTNQHYPGYISEWNCDFNKTKLRYVLQNVRDFQLANNAKILVGEFSVVRWADGGAQYLEDCISIFEEYGWDWLYHCWTDEQISGLEYWSLDHKNGVEGKNSHFANHPTDRKQVVLGAFSLNTFSHSTNDDLKRK